MKTIKVYFEIPTKWVDIESPTFFTHDTLKKRLHDALLEALSEQYLSKVEMPKIEVTKKELKDAVIERMAQEIIDKGSDV